MRILFICTGNTCRSPMAQMLFAEEMKKRGVECECRSAGIAAYTGSPASENSVAVMREVGIDMSDFRSTSFLALMGSEFDLYVPMTYTHAQALLQYGVPKNKIYLFDSDVSDPYGGDIDVYRKTRDELTEKLQTLADFVQDGDSK